MLESLSKDGDDTVDNAWKKMNLYFAFEFYNCVDLFSASIGLRTCLRLSRSPKYAELSHFTLLFCRGRERNIQRL